MPSYRNSENTVEFDFKRLLTPKSEEELSSFLKDAESSERKIKVLGGKHTFSHITKTGDTLLDLREIPDYTRLISVDPMAKTATLGAGMTLGEAVDALDQKGLHFPVLGSYHAQTLGGALATSTHGSSFAHGSLSDQVLEMEVMLADGTKLQLSDRDEVLKAWRCSLGQLGVVTKVRMQLEPAFFLECKVEDVEEEAKGFEDLFRRIANWNGGESQYLSMLWLPYFGNHGRTLTRLLYPRAIQKPNERAVEYETKWMKRDGQWMKNAEQDRGAVLLAKAFTNHPKATKELWSKAMAKAFLDDEGVLDRSFRLFSYDQFREPCQNHWLRLLLNAEIALEASSLEPVYHKIRALLRDALSQGSVVTYPRFHIRVAEASDKTLLGMNAGRRTVYFGTYVCASVNHKDQIPLAVAIEKILDAHGGRPHWGKFRYLGHNEKFKETYGDNISLFENYRRQVDPKGVFSDGYEMFKGLNRFEKNDFFVKPFSSISAKNYRRIRFLGGKSSEL